MDKGIMSYLKLFVVAFFALLHKFKFVDNTQLKLVAVYLLLRGKPFSVLKERSHKFVKGIILNNLTDDFKDNSDCEIYIVSASFDFAIRGLFSPEILVIGSSLNVIDGFISGLKENCYGARKVKRLAELGVHEVDILFTDSLNDIPLAQISKEIRFVRSGYFKTFSRAEFFNKNARS
jgi:hypothetical protein